MGTLKEIVRKVSLKRCRSRVPTGIMALKDIRSAAVLMDARKEDCEQCKNAVLDFYHRNGIAGEIYYFDLRDIEKGERLFTAVGTTVLKRDLNWYGKPSPSIVSTLKARSSDLLISLIDSSDFTLDYLVSSAEARFKIGRKELGDNVFDIVLNGTDALGQYEVFERVKDLLSKIQ